MEPLRMIAEDAGERRTAERLARAGVPVAIVSPAELGQVEAGQLCLATAERAAGLPIGDAVGAGAHVCLISPWPDGGVAIGRDRLTTVPAVRRDPVVWQTPVGVGSTAPARPLRILYRERLVDARAQPLAASTAGEVVLAAWPRTSNLHGVLIASTLLLGQASTQTDPHDVATLLAALQAWTNAIRPDRRAPEREQQASAPPEPSGEREAQVALLALALAAPAVERPAERGVLVAVDAVAVRATARRIGESFGNDYEADDADAAFDSGARYLQALGVLVADQDARSGSGGTPLNVSPAAARDYLERWQLTARLRRLRARAGGEGEADVEYGQ
jgi:hypothetical protein